MIRCLNAIKTYGNRKALNSIDLTLDAGVTALLGPNGAGKSTLLKLLTGLERPSSGIIEVAGFNPATQAFHLMPLLGILPEQLGLFDSLTILETLHAVGPIYALSHSEIERRANALLSLLDLQSARHVLLRNCSYGMRKKTALALALLHNPTVLLLDEPFEGVDPSSVLRIEETLRSLAARGLTVLFTSHIFSVVERLAGRILILNNGTLVHDAPLAPGSSLEDTYFRLTGRPAAQELTWLGS